MNTGRSVTTAAAVLLVAGCGSGQGGAGSQTGEGAVDRSEIVSIVDDLNAYWLEADIELGFEYVVVPPDRVGSRADGITCDLRPIEPEEVEGNAFVDAGCGEGITVVFDPRYLATSLARAEATLAHEWGHVVQAQATELDLSLDSVGLPIDAELQADCFAGAWAAERAEAEITRLRLDSAKAGDPDGIEVDDPHAHGTAEERVAAFDVGLAGGPAACVDELIDVLP